MEETEEKKNNKAKAVKEDKVKEVKDKKKEEKTKKDAKKKTEKETKIKNKEKKIEEKSKTNKKEKSKKQEKQEKDIKKEAKKKTKQKSEDKNQKKKEKIEEIPENIEIFSINLSVLIALFVILVIIIAIIVYLYTKPTNTISNENDVSEVVENQTETKSPRPAVEFDTEEQVKQINGYLRFKSIAMSSPQSLLEIFGLVTEQQFASYPKNSDNTFVKTTISYEAIRNEFQFYITKDLFASEYKNIYKSSNGVTHVANIEKPREDYEIKSHERINTKGKPIIQVWYTTKVDGVESEQKTMKVEFSTYNGRWLISSIK